MTFDEAIKNLRGLSMDGAYKLYSDDVIQLVNELRKEYAPTVEMTPRAYKFLKKEHNKFVKAGNDNFLSNNGLGNWRFYDEHKIDFDTDEEYIDQFTAEHNHFKGLKRTEVIQAWLHPETIKIVDE
ncbi:hypothetical protein QUE93_06350 [Leuconostoc falkenbergense]|uniref:Uncharacterized protein n=1 Tax=Leuconostoc falkenbergense TaxID=2766470 RepID=A0ABT7RZI8_9LACO|nr:hypothetical protein [Leuconostoc falkenbergense]MDM7646634.1 hypothetical protein [Leuconostoc falkenbergense]